MGDQIRIIDIDLVTRDREEVVMLEDLTSTGLSLKRASLHHCTIEEKRKSKNSCRIRKAEKFQTNGDCV